MLHPLIRVVLLLVFIGAMALASPMLLLAGTVLLVCLYLFAGTTVLRSLPRMLLRLRWLLLAIFIVYGWWTPGTMLLPAIGGLSPSLAGLQAGLLRITALLLIVSAVNLLLQTLERGQLLAALYLLTGSLLSKPARERFAVRMLLTLEAVPRVQSILATARRQHAVNGSRLSQLAGSTRTLYNDIIEHAEDSANTPIMFDRPLPPPAQQWLYPLMLLLAISLLAG